MFVFFFRYLRALGVFYLRLVGTSLEIYQYLEPLLNDYRKMRLRLPSMIGRSENGLHFLRSASDIDFTRFTLQKS